MAARLRLLSGLTGLGPESLKILKALLATLPRNWWNCKHLEVRALQFAEVLQSNLFLAAERTPQSGTQDHRGANAR